MDEYIDWKKLVELNVKRLKEVMSESGVDCVIINSMDNFRWLTGIPLTLGWFFRYSHMAVQSRDADEPIILALEGYDVIEKNWFKHVYTLPFSKEVFQPADITNWHKICAKVVTDLGVSKGKIAVDPEMPFIFKDALSKEIRDANIVSASEILRKARLIKNVEEIKAVRVSCAIADIGMKVGLDMIKEGVREREIAGAIVKTLMDYGADVEYMPFVLSGIRPMHIHASEKIIRRDELVRIDFGNLYCGYRSDFSRTMYVGDPPNELRSIYDSLLEAYNECIKALKPGITNNEVYNIISKRFSDATKGKYQIGGFLGHGLGIGVHMMPYFGSNAEEVKLEKGMYFCLEPAVMVKWGNLAVEDDFVLTEEGPEILTRTPREWRA
ncbi:aminopeptidase P family protein [Candidatus Bathyarchaeota archaeon]|nr:aminopeptidase P family protein [Candidatus Bathyarchaeota archaeon]